MNKKTCYEVFVIVVEAQNNIVGHGSLRRRPASPDSHSRHHRLGARRGEAVCFLQPGALAVEGSVGVHRWVAGMLDKEALIAWEYQQMTAALQADKHLTPAKVEAMRASLSAIVNEAVNNLVQIELVIQSFVTQTPDEGRLRVIDEAGSSVNQRLMAMQG